MLQKFNEIGRLQRMFDIPKREEKTSEGSVDDVFLVTVVKRLLRNNEVCTNKDKTKEIYARKLR